MSFREDYMEYSDKEKNILSRLNRANFKNMTKNEVLSIVSDLKELDPEVAKEILRQYPQFAQLVQTTMAEYKNELDIIVSSDDASIKEVYGILNKEMEDHTKGRSEFFEIAEKVRADLSKCIDKEDFSPEEKAKMLDQEMEIVRMADKKEEEVRVQQSKVGESAMNKDSEKREFNWKVVGAASLVTAFALGVGAALLGGKFKIDPPKK